MSATDDGMETGTNEGEMPFAGGGTADNMTGGDPPSRGIASGQGGIGQEPEENRSLGGGGMAGEGGGSSRDAAVGETPQAQ